MRLHIRNYREANRLTAKAGEVIPVGSIAKVVNDGGARKAMKITDVDAASLREGLYGLAFKVSGDPLEVVSSTAGAALGDRIVDIALGDNIVLATNAFVEFAPIDLHASLDPDRGGVLPTAGEALGLKDGLICDAAFAGAVITPVIARAYEVAEGMITVHITETPLN